MFDPWVTAQFLGIVGHTLTGEAVLKGRSMFADRLGDAVANPMITLSMMPPTRRRSRRARSTARASPPAAPLDRRRRTAGLPAQCVFRPSCRIVLDQFGRPVAKSGPSVGAQALTLLPGKQSQADLIDGIDNGFLVQGVSGSTQASTRYRVISPPRAEGLRIRDGELAEPIREVTIASTVQRLLQDVTGIGDDLQWLPMSSAGVSLVVGDVTMSEARMGEIPEPGALPRARASS